MRLQTLLTLVDGKLLNEPAITSFENISFSASKVNRGDLYISLQGNFFDEAIHNGAYIILFDNELQITDEEIAWVKVSSLKTALTKLIRYHLSEKNIKAYKVDTPTSAILASITKDRKLFFLQDTIEASVEKLYNLHENSIVFSSNEEMLKQIFSQVNTISSNKKNLQITFQSLFNFSFIHNMIYYDRVEVSSFFISYFDQVISLLEENSITFSPKNIDPTPHFQVQFIDRFLHPIEFGKSERALILEPDTTLAQLIFSFFVENAKWAKVIALFPDEKPFENSYIYKNIDEIAHILSNEVFGYAIIAGVDVSILEHSSFNSKPVQLSFL